MERLKHSPPIMDKNKQKKLIYLPLSSFLGACKVIIFVGY